MGSGGPLADIRAAVLAPASLYLPAAAFPRARLGSGREGLALALPGRKPSPSLGVLNIQLPALME